jgi:hypothetical protein
MPVKFVGTSHMSNNRQMSDFRIVGGTRSEVVGSVLAGGSIERRATPCCPVSLWCNGCSVGRAMLLLLLLLLLLCDHVDQKV